LLYEKVEIDVEPTKLKNTGFVCILVLENDTIAIY